MQRPTYLFPTLAIAVLTTIAGRGVSGEDLISYRETRNSLQQSYVVKYTDLFPEKGAELRDYIERYRQKAVQEAKSAKNRGDHKLAKQIADDAREHLSGVVTKINRACPPTTITIYGLADRSDLKRAMQSLKDGRSTPGKAIHVYYQDEKLFTSYAVPSSYDMPNGSKLGTVIDPVAASQRGANQNSKPAPGPISDKAKGGLLPTDVDYSGLIGAGAGTGNGLFGIPTP